MDEEFQRKLLTQFASQSSAIALVLRILLDKSIVSHEEVADRLADASDQAALAGGVEASLMFEGLRKALLDPEIAPSTPHRGH